MTQVCSCWVQEKDSGDQGTSTETPNSSQWRFEHLQGDGTSAAVTTYPGPDAAFFLPFHSPATVDNRVVRLNGVLGFIISVATCVFAHSDTAQWVVSYCTFWPRLSHRLPALDVFCMTTPDWFLPRKCLAPVVSNIVSLSAALPGPSVPTACPDSKHFLAIVNWPYTQVLGMVVDFALKLGGFPSPLGTLAALPVAGTRPHLR